MKNLGLTKVMKRKNIYIWSSLEAKMKQFYNQLNVSNDINLY